MGYTEQQLKASMFFSLHNDIHITLASLAGMQIKRNCGADIES